MAGGAALGAAAIWLWRRSQNSVAPGNNEFLMSLQKLVADRFDQVTVHLDRRLAENVKAMNESKSFLADRVSSAERTVREVSTGLGKLEQATSNLQKINEEIASWQNMLRSPKVRGGLGEVLLNNLLAEILPADRYAMQCVLPSSGEIADAMIKLQDGYTVVVDAKFPLANFERYMQTDDAAQKERLKSQLDRDVKKHVSDIGRKYISPRDRTLDFAFMYIPMESVYYETIVRGVGSGSLWEYCLKQRVIPVSPNSFVAYLHTILIGLRGLKIEEQAREILTHLSQVRHDFKQFGEDFSMVGKHITNAKNRFDDSARRLDKFESRLEQIETVGERTLPEADNSKELADNVGDPLVV